MCALVAPAAFCAALRAAVSGSCARGGTRRDDERRAENERAHHGAPTLADVGCFTEVWAT